MTVTIQVWVFVSALCLTCAEKKNCLLQSEVYLYSKCVLGGFIWISHSVFIHHQYKSVIAGNILCAFSILCQQVTEFLRRILQATSHLHTMWTNLDTERLITVKCILKSYSRCTEQWNRWVRIFSRSLQFWDFNFVLAVKVLNTCIFYERSLYRNLAQDF
jgi:hypothetical protein